MKDTDSLEKLGSSLIDLIGFLNSPQRDEALLREAKVSLDRALFPLLVVLGKRGPLGVAELADHVGRDQSTVSRQLAKLERLALVERFENQADRRSKMAQLTTAGNRVVQAIAGARRRLLSKALANWSKADCTALASLNRRFADTLIKRAPEA